MKNINRGTDRCYIIALSFIKIGFVQSEVRLAQSKLSRDTILRLVVLPAGASLGFCSMVLLAMLFLPLDEVHHQPLAFRPA